MTTKSQAAQVQSTVVRSCSSSNPAELHALPLVSVVTPVYNGERYLAECIESVLAQSYQNWEYVIVNNRSTDRTREIAEHYSSRDDRIRIHDNAEFLPLVRNWNHALRQMSRDSKYCKVIHADDVLLPDCLTAMVRLAEESADVGLVGSLRLMVDGTSRSDVRPVTLPSSERVVPGAVACRFYFETWRNYFGTPSNLLIRADLIRKVEAFHNENNQYASDLEAWLAVLSESSLGIVHEVLTSSRRHEGSQTASRFARVKAGNLNRLYLLMRYGRQYMDESEYRQLLARRVLSYQRFLWKSLLTGDWETWRYHRENLDAHGLRIGFSSVLGGAANLALGRFRSGSEGRRPRSSED